MTDQPATRTLLVVGLFAYLWPAVAAAGPQLPATHFEVHKPASVVHALAQTTDRYLWIGTQQGLFRYDGSRFAHFTNFAGAGLTSGTVTALLATAGNALWVGTEDGVAVYEGGVFRTPPGLSVKLGAVRRLVKDARGSIWVATSNGLLQTRDGAWVFHGTSEGLPGMDVHDVVFDPEGGLWVQTAAGRCKQVGDRFVPATATPEVGSTALPLPLLAVPAVRDNPSAWSAFAGAKIGAALWDSKDTLWSSRPGASGLLRWTRKGREVFTMRDGLGGNVITSLLEDGDGGIWAGTYGGGLTHIHLHRLQTLGTKDGLLGDVAYAVVAGPGGGVWVAGSGGIAKVDANRVQTWPLGKAASLVTPRWLAVDRKGAVWAANTDGRVARLAMPLTSASAFAEQFVGNVAPLALHADRDDGVWLSLVDGSVFQLSEGNARAVRGPEGGCLSPTASNPCPTSIRVFAERSAGGLWAGSQARGIWQFAESDTAQALAPAAWNEGAVLAITQDDDGTLWLGTQAGLIRFDGKNTTRLTVREGLPATPVYSLLQDGAGNVWGGGPAGIFKVHAEGKQRALSFVSFGLNDSVASEVMTSDFGTGAARSVDGRLWFTSEAGVTVVEAPEHMPAPRTPTVLIESVASRDKPAHVILYEDEEVAVSRENVRVVFTAPAFLETERLRFAYRVGSDPGGWVNVVDERVAHIVSLPGGTTPFEVAVWRDDRPLSREKARVQLFVSPRYYERPIFFIVFVALLGSFTWAIRAKRRR